MKIRTKILSGYLLIILISFLMVEYVLVNSEKSLRSVIGNKSVVFAQEIMSKISRNIQFRLEQVQVYVFDLSHNDLLIKSNDEFSVIENLDNYIIQKDTEWQALEKNKTTPAIEALLNNKLSIELREEMAVKSFYKKKYDYEIFSEIFITNKYGAIVALTNKTSDYKQDDEGWWQKAKEKGFYVGSVEYDDSSQTYSIPMAVSILDQKNNFLGVIKVVLSIDEIVEIIKESELAIFQDVHVLYGYEKYETMAFNLINNYGELIYSSNVGFGRLEKISDIKFQDIIKNKEASYFLFEEDKKEKIIASVISGGYKDFEGLGWVFTVEHETEEIFSPIIELRNFITIILGIFSFLSLILAWYIARSVSKPIEKLEEGVEIVEKGNIDYRIEIDSKDEVGNLSRAFDRMIATLKKTREQISQKVKDQTKQIEQSQFDLEKQQTAILNVLEDVEEEKEFTKQERDKVNTILEGIGEGVFVVDEKLNIILFNKASVAMSGYSARNVVGKKYDKFLRFYYEDQKNKKSEQDDFVKKVFETGQVREMSNHSVLKRKDGEVVPVSNSAAPLRNKAGKIIGCVVVMHDVTRERKIDRAKTELVSLASHQLRTPLTAINWFSEMLLGGEAGKLNIKQRKYLKDVYTSGLRMAELVDALLSVSRIELGTLMVELEEFNLQKIIDGIFIELDHKIKEKKQKITKNIKGNLNIYSDSKIIQLIFQNLLSNAVKYTQEKGKIDLTVVVDKKNLSITVADNGYGIPQKDQDKIFTKLFRADNIKLRETDGTGLGLYIVKAVVGQLGGTIALDSKEKKGSIFYVNIPLGSKKSKKIN